MYTGCKLSSVDVVYTPWSNLRKTQGMDVGQVGFHSQKLVKKVVVEKKNDIVNRLNKTKTESHPDLARERQVRGADSGYSCPAVVRFECVFCFCGQKGRAPLAGAAGVTLFPSSYATSQHI
jgi:hypothetical protein